MDAQKHNIQYNLLTRSNSSYSDSDKNSQSDMSDANLNDNDLVIVESDKIEETSNMTRKSLLFDATTLLVHFLIMVFVAFVLYLSFSKAVELFTWHPILLSVGWTLLMTEAILSLSAKTYFLRNVAAKNRIRIHWILQTLAACCVAAGFTIVYVNKNIKNKHHFKTWHGIFGLVSVICLAPTCLAGILTLFKVELRRKIKPVLSKILHISLGTLTFIVGTVTVILSLYSNWFVKRTSYTTQIACFILIVVTSLWVIIHPTKFLVNKFIHR